MAIGPSLFTATSIFLLLATLSAQPDIRQYLTRADAAPVFEALGARLPEPEEWPSWIALRDAETRARVAEGDETSIVHWLLFGTSFTSQPRVTANQIDARNIAAAVRERLRDFEAALDRPGGGERAAMARRVLGTGVSVRLRLLSMLERVMKESETHAQLAEAARALNDASLEFAERSRMYRARGLSADTSFRINLAVERALRELTPALKRGAASAAHPVGRVAIVGPGLDFADRQAGYDFYPPQTIQPFAVQDSLIRLGLAAPEALEVTTLDLSTRVNAHITDAAARASRGTAYAIQLPLDNSVRWRADVLGYWRRFGDRIGRPLPATAPERLRELSLRAVSVRPSLVHRVRALDLNVTAEHLSLGPDERFDLVIATNVFVYYDRLQQGLAMLSISNMLRPGGVLLSNNAVVEIPAVGLRSIGYSKTLYSDREEDGDLVIWYQKLVGG